MATQPLKEPPLPMDPLGSAWRQIHAAIDEVLPKILAKGYHGSLVLQVSTANGTINCIRVNQERTYK